MARRPNKPHEEGFEDEEDCCGYYDPDEADRRDCHHYNCACSLSDLRISNNPPHTGKQCYENWNVAEKARLRAEWDAKTPEEQAAHEALIQGLRELY